jgi:hypothetical protein
MSSGTQPRRVVERWHTRAALGVVALLAATAVIATVVSQTSGSPSHEPSAARSQQARDTRRADLEVRGQNPLAVRGTHFRAHERVRLAVKGRGSRLSVKAGAHGTFLAVFKNIVGCDSITVVAQGSKGSRASVNLSQIVCLEYTP